MRVAGYVLGVLLSAISMPLFVRHTGDGGYGRHVKVVSIVATGAVAGRLQRA